MTVLPAPRPIREFAGVNRSRFLEELRPAGEPFIIRGVADGWPAVRHARESDESLVEYLCRFATAEPVDMIVGRPEIEGRFSYTDDVQGLNFVRGRSPMRDFFQRLLRDRGEPRPFAMALQSAVIPVQSLDGINELINYWWADTSASQMPGALSTSLLAMLTLRSLPPQQQRAFIAMIRNYVLAEGGDPGGHIPTAARGILGTPGAKAR